MRILIIVLALLFSHSLLAQRSDLEINDVGGLFEDNYLAYDGGLLHLKLNVIKVRVNAANNTIRLKAVLTTDYGEPMQEFMIYEGFVNEAGQLEILDTVYSQNLDEMSDKSRNLDRLNGVFFIKAKLQENASLFIHFIACSMLEVKIRDDD